MQTVGNVTHRNNTPHRAGAPGRPRHAVEPPSRGGTGKAQRGERYPVHQNCRLNKTEPKTTLGGAQQFRSAYSFTCGGLGVPFPGALCPRCLAGCLAGCLPAALVLAFRLPWRLLSAFFGCCLAGAWRLLLAGSTLVSQWFRVLSSV